MLQSGYSNLHRYTGTGTSTGPVGSGSGGSVTPKSASALVHNEPASLPIIARGGVVARRPTDLARYVFNNPINSQGALASGSPGSKVYTHSQSQYPPYSSYSSYTSYAAPSLSPLTSPDRTPVSTPSPRSTDRTQWFSAWNYVDSPVSSHDLGSSQSQSQSQTQLQHSQSMSRASLPRCAVVNFCRDGDVVRWTPRARENTGGMAARVRDFDDAFQLEELSSRTFGFSAARMGRRNGAHAHAQDIDISGVLSAAVEAGMVAPAPPPARRRNRFAFAVRFARVLRASKPVHAHVKQAPAPLIRTTAAAVTGTGTGNGIGSTTPKHISNDPTSRGSLSMGDIGCVPMRRAGGDTGNGTGAGAGVTRGGAGIETRTGSARSKKYTGFKALFWRRRAQRKRNEMALFDPDTVMKAGNTKQLRKVRSNWWTRTATPTQQHQPQVHYQPDSYQDAYNVTVPAHNQQPVHYLKHRHVDHYIEFMDDF